VESEVQRAIWLANKMGMHGILFTAPYGRYLVAWGNAYLISKKTKKKSSFFFYVVCA
jgi:hypothetical protein